MPLRYPPLLDEFVEKESVAMPTVTELLEMPLEEAKEFTLDARDDVPVTIPEFTVNQIDPGLYWFHLEFRWQNSWYEGSTTAGSNLITMTLAVDEMLSVGAGVTGPGIPANTIIHAFVDAHTIRLSKNATATLTDAEIWFNPGPLNKTLDLYVQRPRDGVWLLIGGATALSKTSTNPPNHAFRFHRTGNSLFAQRVLDEWAGGQWKTLAELKNFYNGSSPVGAGNLNFRFVYGPPTMNDMPDYALFAHPQDLVHTPVETLFKYLPQRPISREITATWKLTSLSVPAGRFMYWQIFNPATNNWSFFYFHNGVTWTPYPIGVTAALDDAPGKFRLRSVADTQIYLEQKLADGSWIFRGLANIPEANTWRLRMLFGPYTLLGLPHLEPKVCGTTNESDVVTMESTADLNVGDGVLGLAIPSGTTIKQILSATSIKLTADATATNASASLQFQQAAHVILDDGDSPPHKAEIARAPSGAGADRGKGGVTVPKGKWQARVDVASNQTVPPGAIIYLQAIIGGAWRNLATWTKPTAPATTGIHPGNHLKFSGVNSGAFTSDTFVRFLYFGGVGGSGRPTLGTGYIETVVFPPSKTVKLEVSDTVGLDRTMIAKNADGDPVKMFKPGHKDSFWQIAHRRELPSLNSWEWPPLSRRSRATRFASRADGK